jgi:hypothetical protein
MLKKYIETTCISNIYLFFEKKKTNPLQITW